MDKAHSVIIPTRGRNSLVHESLSALANLDYDLSSVEVLVVDNNDNDELADGLRSTCAEFAGLVRYVAEPSPGLTAARHTGAHEARGDVLSYLDDDALVSPAWAQSICNAFNNEEVGIVGGPSIPAFRCSIPAWFWGFIEKPPFGGWFSGWLSLLDPGRDVKCIDPEWVWGLNFSIRRSVLFALGGFNPDLVPGRLQRWQGDGETGLSNKARESGIRADHVHKALVHHIVNDDRLTMEYFEQRAYYQGVCDSFSRIRSGETPTIASPGPKPVPQVADANALMAESFPVRLRTTEAYNEGWSFHQREVCSDPDLLAWVKRKNFLQADIRQQANYPLTQSP